MTAAELERLQRCYRAATEGMVKVSQALADLMIAMAPLVGEAQAKAIALAAEEPMPPAAQDDPCTYPDCKRRSQRGKDRCYWHRREVHPFGARSDDPEGGSSEGGGR